jgi:tellurite resistance protein
MTARWGAKLDYPVFNSIHELRDHARECISKSSSVFAQSVITASRLIAAAKGAIIARWAAH